jgi:transcriptional regulator NrdR family protein
MRDIKVCTCGGKFYTVDSRYITKSGIVKRMRQCRRCGTRIITQETFVREAQEQEHLMTVDDNEEG